MVADNKPDQSELTVRKLSGDGEEIAVEGDSLIKAEIARLQNLLDGGPVADKMHYRSLWTIRKFADDAAFDAGEAFEVVEIDGNILLNEGITRLQNLLIGGGGTVYDNTNARLGVGDDATAAVASQTDLQAATNKLYKGMEATYPQIAGQITTWRSVFGSSEGNYDWNEFTVDNGAGATENLNRKVSAQGTKAAGQTWTLDLQITWS